MDQSLPLSEGPAGDAGDLPLVLVLPDAPSPPPSHPGSEWEISLEISCRTEARSWQFISVGGVLVYGVCRELSVAVFFWVACSAAVLSGLENPGVVVGAVG